MRFQCVCCNPYPHMTTDWCFYPTDLQHEMRNLLLAEVGPEASTLYIKREFNAWANKQLATAETATGMSTGSRLGLWAHIGATFLASIAAVLRRE